MQQFMILYSSTANAKELMANTTPQEMQANMAEWVAWRDKASNKTLKINFGLPMQAVDNVSANGVTNSMSQISGHSIAESESKEALTELLKDHPHLQREGSSIDILEMLSMPGFNT